MDAPVPELAAREWLDRMSVSSRNERRGDSSGHWRSCQSRWQNPEIPVYPPVFVKKGEEQRIHYYQDSVYGTLYKSIRNEAEYMSRWYRLDPDARVSGWKMEAPGQSMRGEAFPMYGKLLWILILTKRESNSGDGGIIHTEFYAGRGTDCLIHLKGLRVSRRHACFYYDGLHWLIQDLKSTNGVELNGKKVSVRVPEKG